MMSSAAHFSITGPLPTGRLVVEASAGTGKTYALAALAVRALVETDLRADQLLVVTFTKAAAAELRERIRHVLGEAAQTLAGEPHREPWMAVLVDASPAALVIRRQRAARALADYDRASITTIHGFCQQALSQLGLRSGLGGSRTLADESADLVREVCRDLLVDRLADDPAALGSGIEAGRVERLLNLTVHARLTSPHAVVMPPSGCDALSDEWLSLGERAAAEVHRRTEARALLTFDGMVLAVHRAVYDAEHGDRACDALRDRYRMVLVDESQDTDPTQWQIFERVFGQSTLVTVGDPKQAIYRFRGADVHAYLASTEGHEAMSLGVNFRSTPDVVAGLDVLMRGATLGDPRIAVVPVDVARSSPEANASLGSGVVLHVVPNDDTLLNRTGKSLATPSVRRLVLADLSRRVVDLLGSAEHGWVPNDIAVLVPSHGDALAVAEVLRRAGVASTRTRTGSVLATDAVPQWELLLAALARPGQSAVVRAAALGWLLGGTAADALVEPSGAVVAALQERCAQLAATLSRRGVMALYHQLLDDSTVLPRLLGGPDGERRVTDLAHVAELLADATHGTITEPPNVQRALAELAAAGVPADGQMRRIDTDAPAVQISTIHGAKGLEFPVVLLPFAFKPRPAGGSPRSWVVPGERSGVRYLDGASAVEWQADRLNELSRRELTGADLDGDGERLLYVALTRAAERVEMWWANAYQWTTAPLAKLLFDRDGASPIRNSGGGVRVLGNGRLGVVNAAYRSKLSIGDAHQQIVTLVDASDGRISLRFVPLDERVPTPASRPPDARDDRALATAPQHGREAAIDPGWQSWSFTALAARSAHHDEVPAAGGFDEGGDRGNASDDDGRLAARSAADWVAGGALTGTVVHTILESFQPGHPDCASHLRAISEEVIAAAGAALDPTLVATWMEQVVASPLGPAFAEHTLASLPGTARLAEMRFDLPLAHLDGGAIAATAAEHLDNQDPFRRSLGVLAESLRGLPVTGFLTGSVDALFRVPLPQGPSFVVVDYKTNRLAGYEAESVAAAMIAHHYELQALLYMVATHRLLRWRLGAGYLPERHLGGASYLFLRGMIGPDTPRIDGVPAGIYVWRPPVAAVIAVDQLIGGNR